MARRTLVEIELAITDKDGELVYEEDNQIFERKKAWLHHWGADVKYITDEEGKIIFANQVTVAIVEECESGDVLKVDPQNIKVIGFETYDFKK